MPYYIGDVARAREIEKYVVRPPEVFKREHDIDIHVRSEVIGIDRKAKEVFIIDHEREREFIRKYGKLIVSTGSRSRKLGIRGEDAPNVFNLKELTDARRLKEYISKKTPKKVVTIGAGFIALEMAEAFGELGLDNTIIYRGELPMRYLSGDISGMIRDELEGHGVAFIPDANVLSFDIGDDGVVMSVVTDKGKFDADMVLVSVGVTPNVEVARDSGIEIGESGAIKVDEWQRTSDADIYAAGDCCEVINRISGKGVNVPLGDLANKQGWVAGENAAGGDARYPGILGSAHFKVFDLEVGFTGLTPGQAEKEGIDVLSNSIEGNSKPRLYPGSAPLRVNLVVDKESRRLIGAQIAGRDGAALRINVLAAALAGGLTIDEVVDIDLAYAPPFSPTIDPILTAARAIQKKI